MEKKIRILIARLGMDAHWRGSIVVAKALRDAGMQPEEAVALLMKDKGFDSQIVSALANVAAADLQQAIATADAASKKSAPAAGFAAMEGQGGQNEQENSVDVAPADSAAAE